MATPFDESADADFVEKNGEKYLWDPETEQYLIICNVESYISQLSAQNERDYELEKQFEAHRSAQKEASRKDYQVQTASSYMPVPGGVGYGAYYKSSFQNDFTTGTILSSDIICPNKAGGDVSNYLYLTSTNRAAKGVEAFISYYAQDDFHFRIYDWARPSASRWQTNLTRSQLSNYITTKYINGTSRQIITVQNWTVKTSSTKWKNIVYLRNYTNGSFDLIYSYEYTATLSDQRDSYYGSWGPIVETFQTSYNSNLNIVGFYLAQVKSKDSSSTWGSWQLLTTSVTTIRQDSVGLALVFNSPNYTFAVH